MAIDWIYSGKPTTVGVCTGAVAGLVAITPAAGSTGVLGAIVIGSRPSVVCYFMVAYVKPKLGYDDALDAFGVHGIGGNHRFCTHGRLRIGCHHRWSQRRTLWRLASVGRSLIATGFAIVYNGVIISFILFKVIDKTMGIRVEPRVEEEGLDIYEHGENAYN